MKNKKIIVPEVKKDNAISRRDAMTRLGLSAFSVATMLLLLNKPESAQAQASDTPIDPGDPVW